MELKFKYSNISVLLNKKITNIKGSEKGEKEIIFETSEGKVYKMYHEQDCCESVKVEEVIGDLTDLIGHPLTMAEAVSQRGENEWGTNTWTFYKLATIKGYVTIRWLGESNGYYSESVDFVEIIN